MIFGRGTKIPHALKLSQKKKKQSSVMPTKNRRKVTDRSPRRSIAENKRKREPAM